MSFGWVKESTPRGRKAADGLAADKYSSRVLWMDGWMDGWMVVMLCSSSVREKVLFVVGLVGSDIWLVA